MKECGLDFEESLHTGEFKFLASDDVVYEDLEEES